MHHPQNWLSQHNALLGHLLPQTHVRITGDWILEISTMAMMRLSDTASILGTDLGVGLSSPQVGSQVLFHPLNELLSVTVGMHPHNLQPTMVNPQQHVQLHMLCLKLVNVLLQHPSPMFTDCSLLLSHLTHAVCYSDFHQKALPTHRLLVPMTENLSKSCPQACSHCYDCALLA